MNSPDMTAAMIAPTPRMSGTRTGSAPIAPVSSSNTATAKEQGLPVLSDLNKPGDLVSYVGWLGSLLTAILVVYAFLLNPLGYIIATALLFPAVAYVLGSRGRRKVLRNLAIGVALGVLVFFSFTELLGVRLPDGVLDPLL